MVRQSKAAKRQKKRGIISLRRRGLSYSEIKSRFPVSKSTLSAWLKRIKISDRHRRELRRRSIRGLLKGAEQKRMRRIAETSVIHSSAMQDVKTISKKELWLMGIVLYWACGLEEKNERSGLGVRFSNSDPSIVRFFIQWLNQVGNIKKREIAFDLYLHESRKMALQDITDHWAKTVGFSKNCFSHIYFYKHTLKRKGTLLKKPSYGLIRIRVKASTRLARQISGWVHGIKTLLDHNNPHKHY